MYRSRNRSSDLRIFDQNLSRVFIDHSPFFFSSEAGNGAVEPSINHPVVDEEDQRLQEDEANETAADDLVTLRARYVDDPTDEAPIATKTTQSLPENVSRSSEEGIVEPLQRDQSDLLVSVAVNDEVDGDPLGSESRERESGRAQQASKDFVASTRPNRVEIASSIGSSGVVVDQLDGVQVEDEGLSNVVERGESGSNADKWRRGGSAGFTTASIRETTEVAIERKNVEDIRAISFQVPAVVEEAEEVVDRQQGNEQPRKDHSRPVNNLLLAGGKSTKAFYEIKPSIKTEMDLGDQVSSTIGTQRPLHARKFVLPSVDSAFGKFGPYFEDGDQEINITARIGSTMLLDCKIGMLGNKEVISFCLVSFSSSFSFCVSRMNFKGF